MTSPLEAYLRDNPQLRGMDRGKLIDELYQTSGVDDKGAFTKSLLIDADADKSTIGGYDFSWTKRQIDKGVAAAKTVGGVAGAAGQGARRGFQESVGDTLETLQQVPDALGIPKDPPEKDWSPGAVGKKIKESAPVVKYDNSAEKAAAIGGYIAGHVPGAVATWVGGVPAAVLHGTHEAETQAKEQGIKRHTTGIDIPSMARRGGKTVANYLGSEAELPERIGGSVITSITPKSWHEIPEGGGATVWEKLRAGLIEGGARAYLGWVMKALKPQRWLQQSFHFAGTQGVVDLFEQKGYDEQVINFGTSFLLSAAVGKLTAKNIAHLEEAKKLAAQGEGEGAMRHLDAVLTDPEVATAIALAARTRDLRLPAALDMYHARRELDGVNARLRQIDTQMQTTRSQYGKAHLENEKLDLEEQALSLYWRTIPERELPDVGPRAGQLPPVGATERLDKWTAWQRAEATLAADIAMQQKRNAAFADWATQSERLFHGVPSQQRLGMISSYMRGQMEEIPEAYRPFFQRMKTEMDRAYRGERATEIEYEYRDNYFHLQWEPKDGEAAQRMGAMANRVGRPQFSRQKEFDDVMEGVAAGMKLRNDNPAVMAINRLEASNMARAKVESMHHLVDDGLAIPRNAAPWEKAPADAGPNWKPTFPPQFYGWTQMTVGGKEYWVQPDAATFYKRAFAMDQKALTDMFGLSPHGLTVRSLKQAGDAWMAVRNLMIPMKLSMSGFHANHVVQINMAQQVGALLNAKGRGTITFADFAKGLKDIDFVGQYAYGARLRENIKKPYHELSAMEQVERDILIAGGFHPAQPDVYQLRTQRAYERAHFDQAPRYRDALSQAQKIDPAHASDLVAAQTYKDALAEFTPQFTKDIALNADALAALYGVSKEEAKAIGSKLSQMIEHIQEPLFADWIPAMKNAAYMNEAKIILSSRPELLAGTAEAQESLRREMTKTRKNIDDRFGEMQYEKMFWATWLKRVAIGSMLSVGWNFGALRQYGGAITDTMRVEVGRGGFRGLPTTELTSRMTYAGLYAGLALGTSGLMTLVNTGRVEGVKDMLYPVLPDGTRVNTPFQSRVFGEAYYHTRNEGAMDGVKRLLANKLNSPFSATWYLLDNEDFFGREIYDPRAPISKQLPQMVGWWLKEAAAPISFTSTFGQDTDIPLGKVGYALWGYTKAPGYIELSPAESQIHRLTLHRQKFHTTFNERDYNDKMFQLSRLRNIASQTDAAGDWEKFEDLQSEMMKEYPEHFQNAGVETQRQRRARVSARKAWQFQSLLQPEEQVEVLKRMAKDEPENFVKYIGFARSSIRNPHTLTEDARERWKIDEATAAMFEEAWRAHQQLFGGSNARRSPLPRPGAPSKPKTERAPFNFTPSWEQKSTPDNPPPQPGPSAPPAFNWTPSWRQ